MSDQDDNRFYREKLKPCAWLLRETFRVGRPRVLSGRMFVSEDAAKAAALRMSRNSRRTIEAFAVVPL